jgi:hypothetical protein
MMARRAVAVYDARDISAPGDGGGDDVVPLRRKANREQEQAALHKHPSL